MSTSVKILITIHRDNIAFIAQGKEQYIKSDMTNSISPNLFKELQKNNETEIKHICFENNLSDLYTEALPASISKKLLMILAQEESTTNHRYQTILNWGSAIYNYVI